MRLRQNERAIDKIQPANDIARDSAILRFDLTFEVAWKLVQLLVRDQGLEANSPRQAFQQAFILGWITDEENLGRYYPGPQYRYSRLSPGTCRGALS
ncbi:MAG: nucleotidyltransferase substrate binding protein [Anaerolineae bacterium]|nr:nucleotidyltransferase substrate binding protein [Anaerolineae bacterium]